MVDGISNKAAGLGAPVVRFDPAAHAAKAAATPAADTPAAEPKAELSALAIEAHDAGSAPVDGARVERIRQAIADGSYTVDHEKIAAKMLELDLGWAAEK